MSNKNKNDKNRGGGNNYDRRIIIDPPSSQEKNEIKEPISAKRKGFYIILLLGITAIGIYAVLNSLLPNTIAKKPNQTPTASSAYSSPSPDYESVPANAPGVPYDASEPMTDNEINSQTKTTEKPKNTPEPEMTQAPISQNSKPELAQPPVSGKIVKDFSDTDLVYSETMNDWRTHAGVDIAANLDMPITAISDGTLKKVYEDSLFGTTVIVNHKDAGYDSIYCNLKDATTEPIGATIKMGDVLGKVGKSAVSETNEQPHLHFEIKVDDTFLDPKEFVKFEEVDYVQETDEPASVSTTTMPQSDMEDNPSESLPPITTDEIADYNVDEIFED